MIANIYFSKQERHEKNKLELFNRYNWKYLDLASGKSDQNCPKPSCCYPFLGWETYQLHEQR